MKKGFYLTLNIRVIFGLIAVILSFAVFVVAVAANRTAYVFHNSEVERPVIIIDAGHGGEDGGTQSESGILEKDINLSIAIKLNEILTRNGFKTVMVRTEDKMIYDEGSSTVKSRKTSDLHNRMLIMDTYENSIFVSIHQNHFRQGKYSGAQVFYRPEHAESTALAESIQKSIVANLQKDNTRQIKSCTSDVYLINKAVTTAVMVECGFLSNKAEAEKLNDRNYQYEMALAIAKGIKDYLNPERS